MVKNFAEDTWEIFNEKAKKKKIYVWGAGFRGKEIAENVKKYASPWEIAGFIDSNPSIMECGGYPVVSSDKVKELDKDTLILISNDKPGLITQILDEMGMEEYYSYYWMNVGKKDFLLQKNIDEKKIEQVQKLLADIKSKQILERIIEKRKKGYLDYTDIQESGDEYFDHNFFHYNDREVLVDGGGYDGDTIEEFTEYTKSTYKKIYSFEPDAQTGKKLKSKLHRYRNKVIFYPYGLYEKRGRYSFVNDNITYSSHMADGEMATSYIDCVAVDEIVKGESVTFIKMDIEGAEISALKGAKQTIMKNQPKLAVCIYHRLEDLWEIPLLIHSYVPEYKFYIRHYGSRYYGTILFATL